MKTKLEIIEETAAFYNSNNRSVGYRVDDRGEVIQDACMYIGPDGKRCAFSRCCSHEGVAMLTEGWSVEHINDIVREQALKPEYQGKYPALFWRDIQALHDTASYWNANGLTETGQTRVDELKRRYREGVSE